MKQQKLYMDDDTKVKLKELAKVYGDMSKAAKAAIELAYEIRDSTPPSLPRNSLEDLPDYQRLLSFVA